MNKIQALLLVVQLVFLAVSAGVEAQSAAVPSYAVPSDPVPPDRLPAWPEQQAGQRGLASKVKGTETRRHVHASVDTRTASKLCFLPGIGWQMVTILNVQDTTEMSGTQSSNLKGVKQATFVGVAQSDYKHPSGTNWNSNTTCSGTFSSVAAPEVFKENYGKAMSSDKPTGIYSGTQAWSNSNSPINDSVISVVDSGIPHGGRVMGWSSTEVGGTSLLPERSSGLMGRAHLNPIELRREIRNAPDLTTRIRLRRLQNALEHSSPALTVNPTRRRIRKKNLSGLFEGKANSSSLDRVRDHAKGSTKVSSLPIH